MDSLVNKVSANYIEDNVAQFNGVVQGFVGQINQSSTDQYQQFNQALKDSFGANLQQIQETIQNLSEEVMVTKQQMTEVTNRLEDVDLQGRKGLAELSDQVEIERMMNELVSWVAEEQKWWMNMMERQYNLILIE